MLQPGNASITPPVPGPQPGPKPDPEPEPGSDPDLIPPTAPEPDPDLVPLPMPEPEPMPYAADREMGSHRWRCQFSGSMANLEVHRQQFRSYSGSEHEDNLIMHAGTTIAQFIRDRQARTWSPLQ